MMRAALLLVFSWAVGVLAHHDPITEFPAGYYLGEGRLVYSTGEEATYSSFAAINSDKLAFAIARDGELFAYHLYFQFDERGFFTVEASERTDNGAGVATHYGQGYCASVQCHFSFETDDRIVEETITFATWESKIYTIGSMRYLDENGEEQTLAWEEQFLLLEDSSDEEE